MSDEFAAVDALAEEFQARGGQPGLAYGVVADGQLVHARGLGERWVGGPAPDERTVFRIASMTKSFTAAAVLLLRDEGTLALDDPAVTYVPQLCGLRPPAGSPPITIRRLLTMTAGFPTDDPWGDRQQGLPLKEFAELLEGGLNFAWTPGTGFEYSNLGYAVLGMVVTAASGMDYAEFVRARLLRPLGMTATGYEAAGFSPDQLARGHRHGDGWEELEPDPYGAFAPMGGVFSCVGDLAKWVAGFAAAYAVEGDGGHPLRRASRLEMQSPQVTIPSGRLTRLPGGPVGGGPAGYGFGLFVEHDPALGTVVQHSGGYPGFGSNMRWHPGAGLGTIVLANRTYAGASWLSARLLDTLARGRPRRATGVSGPAPHPAGPWPQTLAARDKATRLLQAWDDVAAERLFSENVAQDEPFAGRRAAAETLRNRIGEFAVDAGRPAEHDSPAHCRWWLRGERGVAAVSVLLTPERSPQVQKFDLAIPLAPGSPLAGVVEALVSVMNGTSGSLSGQPAAASLDKTLLARQLRMAGAWTGRCVPGACRAGNGDTTTTLELDGEHARATLSVLVDAAGVLQQADVFLGP